MAGYEVILYPNCSMGGMATVYRNRIRSQPQKQFKLIFLFDKGGKSYYDNLPNVELVIVRRDRLDSYLRYLTATIHINAAYITSLPDAANLLSDLKIKVNYEFHSSTDSILRKEIEKLDSKSLFRIQVPSNYLFNIIHGYIETEDKDKVVIVPNLVDEHMFSFVENVDLNIDFDGRIPLVWVGRLDSGKNVNDFLRALTLLEEHYVGIVILGLESDPQRFSKYIGYASTLGVADRIHTLVNLPQAGIASIYNKARIDGGYFVSTSLAESFGYGVQEALQTGLSTVAYDVGALSERVPHYGAQYHLVDVGDVAELVGVIRHAERN